MSKHTKGPWPLTFMHRPIDGVEISCEVRLGNHSSIATLQSAEHLGRTGMHADECIANARLIAAAPELLEALKALTHSIDQSELLHDDQRAAFKTSIQAIAKATWEQS